MKILLDSNNVGIFLGLDYSINEEYVSINGAVNTQYNLSNTTEIDEICPEPPLSNCWKWENDSWVCINQEEVDSYNLNLQIQFNSKQKKNRFLAYTIESDPIFFKFQRGEATKQDWLDKVSEINSRFPYQGGV